MLSKKTKEKLALEFNLTHDQIEKIHKEYWKAIIDHMRSVDFENKKENEILNYIIPHICKLEFNYKKYINIKNNAKKIKTKNTDSDV